MDLDLLCEEYLKYSKHFKSKGSYRYDRSHLRYITKYLTDIGLSDSDDLDFDAIYNFIDESRENENSNATINKRISILNRAIAFQVSQNKCNPSIIAAFPKLKEEDKRFDLVDENTMVRIIKYLMNQKDNFMNIRNRALVFLFIDCGARLSEVALIKTKNINFDDRSILLEHTKTKRQRIVFFSEPTKKLLLEYYHLVDSSHSLFWRNSHNNEPMKYLGIIRVFHKIRDALGLEKLSSHMIRHSYGTLAYKKNVPQLFTKNTMGHARIEMTERYTHYDIETNRKIYDQFSPITHYMNIKK